MSKFDTLSTRVHRHRPEDDGALAVLGVGFSCLLIAFVLFLTGSGLTAVPFLGFLVAAGVGWIAYQPTTAKWLMFLATVVTVMTLGLIVAFIVREAIPAIRMMGVDLLIRTNEPLWGSGTFSLAPMIVGTATTTVIAMTIAAPLGIAGALFLSEIAPSTVREIVKPGIELLAGIPSITYGFIGFVIINGFFDSQLQTPTIGNYFTVGLVIGIMALPTIVTVAEDAISTVPESMKSGSLAVGTTDWQTMKSVTIPAAFSGISAAVLLGVGRAMGETMAATVMIPHTKGFPSPLFDVFGGTGETLTTVIAFEGGNASGTHMSALFAAGVILFLTVLTLSVASQIIESRMQRKLGGKQ
ncbi:phosphate ABC transporter permease subunit PstC [Halocatena pleomorpha]|uniref:Phosphate transport system permease protein n=1 Tax=Halocatena pleomorpha TaxID=1785090 RepID=A0A3P3RKE5_9EURY|nr:phosphate ABC transporter permease subunit PstC [Halocatena pleomorpha]RRJ33804.1 phosphate ABC transporter permease subunit PstC [Halocatena pleomorpha]